MRCLLNSANLGPKYWSYTLTHATYNKNRFPHQAITITPYEALTSFQPDISNLRFFALRLYAKKPSQRNANLIIIHLMIYFWEILLLIKMCIILMIQ